MLFRNVSYIEYLHLNMVTLVLKDRYLSNDSCGDEKKESPPTFNTPALKSLWAVKKIFEFAFERSKKSH